MTIRMIPIVPDLFIIAPYYLFLFRDVLCVRQSLAGTREGASAPPPL
ncbi:MAG: hypothetical protein XU15_C0020G0002 [candidate division NC10 bacterium CSP1-5]|nr:MAG: hypothetical protein XU15_C0020G0002 [candidate division NC10 bacterium CSP1-5]